MKLSKNFTLRELLKSSTATRAGGAILENQMNPPQKIIDALKYHCQNTVQVARGWFKCSIMIGSGYRGPKLNTKVGGSPNSQHCLGEATDQELSEKFLDHNSNKKKQLDALIHAVTGKPVRVDVNSNFYLFAFYVLHIHYVDIDQVIHEYGEDGQPDWVHASSSEELNRREILSVKKMKIKGKMKSVYTQLNTKEALMLGC
jgi:hypothetical protein